MRKEELQKELRLELKGEDYIFNCEGRYNIKNTNKVALVFEVQDGYEIICKNALFP